MTKQRYTPVISDTFDDGDVIEYILTNTKSAAALRVEINAPQSPYDVDIETSDDGENFYKAIDSPITINQTDEVWVGTTNVSKAVRVTVTNNSGSVIDITGTIRTDSSIDNPTPQAFASRSPNDNNRPEAFVNGKGIYNFKSASGGSLSTVNQSIEDTMLTQRMRPTGHPKFASTAGVYGSRDKGIIALETDDARTETYTEAYPDLKDRGLPWSIAVPVDTMADSEHVSWSELEEMAAHGAEITVHSGGVDLVSGTEDEIYHELVEQFETLRDRGIEPASIVTAGNPNFESLADLKTYGGRLALGKYLRVRGVKRNPAASDSYGGFGGGVTDSAHQIERMSQTEVEAVIDAAVTSRSAITLYWHPHDIGDTGVLTRSELQSILDTIETERNNGNINVVTPTSAKHLVGDSHDHHINGHPGIEKSSAIQSSEQVVGCYYNASGDSSRNTSQSRSGSASLELAGGNGTVQQIVRVPDATRCLAVECYIKSKNTDSHGTLRVYNNATNNWPDYSGLQGQKDQDTTNNWTKYCVSIGITKDANAAKVDIRNIGNNPILVDDIYIYPA